MNSRIEYWQKEMVETVRTIGVAVLLAMIFRSFLFEPFHIPSGSMKGNLLIGDYLFVSKFEYGYSRFSFPYGSWLPSFGRIMGENEPERGDVVVFRKPTDVSTDYIKRVIGLPGDRIQMRDGVLYINGAAVPKLPADEFLEYDERAQSVRRTPQFQETLPEGKTYYVLDDDPFGAVDSTRVYTVPEGHYFMMGDNRDNSVDSRYTDQVGFVPKENLVGKAEIIVFSLDKDFSLRTNRFLQWVR